MMRPLPIASIDRAISRACINQNRAGLARALRLARAAGLGRAALDWACWVGWPVRLAPDCPTCGEGETLYRTEDPAAMDGDGPRCRACWASLWEHGKLHIPEAWERAVCPFCEAREDADCVGCSCHSCGGRGVFVLASVTAPVLVEVLRA